MDNFFYYRQHPISIRMNKARHYIASFRLRTLPLSLSGIFLGTLLASAHGFFQTTPFLLAVATTLSLQILSNLANELGDLQKGTDNTERLGPIRSIQSGALTLSEFKRTIAVFAILSVCFGILLVYSAFDQLFTRDGIVMLLLGAAAIIAAIKYTIGKGAYGYHGLGDLSVFLFFGLLSVAGSWFLMVRQIIPAIFLPATAIGLLSVGVLNLNNMRDVENDKVCGKHTIPVFIGVHRAKIYHFFLIIGAFWAMIAYVPFQDFRLSKLLFLLSLPLFAIHLKQVSRSQGRALDPQLKMLSLSTLLFALLAGIGFAI